MSENIEVAGLAVLDEATVYAERLARQLHYKHYKDNLDWEPLSGDLIGILTQIDNMTSGLGIISTAEAGGLVERLRDLLQEIEDSADLTAVMSGQLYDRLIDVLSTSPQGGEHGE